MFYLIGLGLGDPSDVSLRGQQIIKRCERVYLEAYTSILLHGAKETLEEFHGKSILLADREQVEQGASELLAGAQESDISLLVVGDPLGATTHTDLMLRATENDIPVTVVSNASVLTAVGITGLDMAKFGEVVSIPFWEDSWKPDSFYNKITTNLKNGLHTLCLLDIKVKEQSVENIIKNRKIFEPPRFMRTDQAAGQLMAIINGLDEEVSGEGANVDTPCIACVRLGSPGQHNLVDTLKGISQHDLGPPLHSLVICAPLTATEQRHAAALARHYTGVPDTDSGTKSGALHLVGLGMSLDDLTVKGLRSLQQCSGNTLIDVTTRRILKAQHADILHRTKSCIKDELSNFIDIFDSDTTVEFSPRNTQCLMEKLRSGKEVAIVVWGDPLVFTDYCAVLEEVINEGFNFSVIHNASILNSIASCGLQLYTFGETVEFPTPDVDTNEDACKSFISDKSSFFNKIVRNHTAGWHTLCLLHSINDTNSSDSDASLQYWSPDRACRLLLSVLSQSSVANTGSLTPTSLLVGVAGIGGDAPQLKIGSLSVIAQQKFTTTGPVCALIITGNMHPLELDCLNLLTEKVQEEGDT